MNTPHKSQRVARVSPPGSGQVEDSSAFGSLGRACKMACLCRQPCSDLSSHRQNPGSLSSLPQANRQPVATAFGVEVLEHSPGDSQEENPESLHLRVGLEVLGCQGLRLIQTGPADGQVA